MSQQLKYKNEHHLVTVSRSLI